ncbi:hypothetical protein [Nocardia sp. NBC_01329]|uniref:hypothetical protein n=1 Tax=Nocardia sp. NBC_01329 TaxID=2903594 RepID=UPI002E1206C9|nr:hypothetical protein OG405_15045 [Nocardia sp. NBC_01329]
MDIAEIGWAIGIYDQPGTIVHGLFGATASEMYSVEDGEVRTRAFLPEPETGKSAADATIAALQTCGATSPKDLWCEAWTPRQPRQLAAVRFGLRGDRPDPIERDPDS